MENIEKCKLRQGDCLELMKNVPDNCVDFTLTDIPYDAVSRSSNGLRNLDKGKADILTFDLQEFLEGILRITRNSVCIFVGKNNLVLFMIFLPNKRVQLGLLFGKNQTQVQ